MCNKSEDLKSIGQQQRGVVGGEEGGGGVIVATCHDIKAK